MNKESRIISDDICDALGVTRGSLVWSYNKSYYVYCPNFWKIAQLPEGIVSVFEQMSVDDVLHVSNYTGYLETKFHHNKINNILSQQPRLREEFVKAHPDINPDGISEHQVKMNKGSITHLLYWLHRIVTDSINTFYENALSNK
jgi:hypothetical protein